MATRLVPLGLVTILDPKNKNGLALLDEDLPVPQWRDRNAANAKLKTRAAELGVTAKERGKAVDLGTQPFENLRGKHVPCVYLRHLLLRGDYHALYVNVSGQLKLELRPTLAFAGTPGVLNQPQMNMILQIFERDVDFLKVAGLWINPTEDGETANLVLRPIQNEEKLDVLQHLPILYKLDKLFVEVPT